MTDGYLRDLALFSLWKAGLEPDEESVVLLKRYFRHTRIDGKVPTLEQGVEAIEYMLRRWGALVDVQGEAR